MTGADDGVAGESPYGADLPPDARELARAAWSSMATPERAARVREVDDGTSYPDLRGAALGVLLADRSLERLRAAAAPRRLLAWQVVTGVVALALAALAALSVDDAVGVTVLAGLLALLFGRQTVLAPRQVHRRVAAVERGRTANLATVLRSEPG